MNSVPFRLLKFILLVQDFIFSIRCRIRQGSSHLKLMGSFQVWLQFGSISAHQISSPHQETLYFQFGAEFGKGFPIWNAWGVFKFGFNSVPFRLIRYLFLIKRLYIFNSVPNSARVYPFKIHGQFLNSVWIRFLFGYSSLFSWSKTLFFQFGAEFGKVFPI